MIPAGFQKNSFIDFPGKISCVVFVSGCNFRCPYCHNPELVQTSGQPSASLSSDTILEFLKQRKGFLNGVVITGGEPTLQESILGFCHKVKDLGYAIKLDTNGSRPVFLKKLIDLDVVDYVAMDIKTDPYDYAPVFVTHDIAEDILDSIHIIMASGRDYEFRTTIARPIINADTIKKIGAHIKEAKRYCLQQFQATHVLNPKFFEGHDPAFADEDLDMFRDIALEHVHECIVR